MGRFSREFTDNNIQDNGSSINSNELKTEVEVNKCGINSYY
jgi:hypothetical protein